MRREGIVDWNDERATDYFQEIEKRLSPGGNLTAELGHRFQLAEGRGIVGWKKSDNDTAILIWDEIPDSGSISLADQFARCLGSEEAFFELYEVAFGGAGEWFLTWIIERTVEWAAGQGLSLLFEKLQHPTTVRLAEQLKERSEFEQKDGKLYIKVRPDGETLLREIVIEVDLLRRP
jgi:hypothetical protein